MDISQAWGYGAVVFPKKLEWQGFWIPNPDGHMAPFVERAIEAASKAMMMSPEYVTTLEGPISAAVVDRLMAGEQAGMGMMASALSKIIEKRFWVIDAEESDGRMLTRIRHLDVQTAEAARDQINREVLPLKMGQALKTMRESRRSR